MANRGWKPFLVDICTGGGTFALILIAAGIFRRHESVLAVLMIAIAAGAAIARAGREPRVAWVHGLLVGLVAVGPIVLLAVVMAGSKSNPGAWVFLLSAAILCGAVAWAVALWRSGSPAIGVAALLGSAAVLSLLWTVGLRVLGPKPKLVRMDKPLPELGLKRMDGTPIAESDLRGHVIVMDFWGTWCPSCVEEMPVLNDVAGSYSANPKVQFLIVNSELNGDEPGRIAAFVRSEGISIPVALDPAQSCFKLDTELFPTTVVIDAHGHMRFERSGYNGSRSTRKELRSEVDELLREQ